jgi:hypothetical protein
MLASELRELETDGVDLRPARLGKDGGKTRPANRPESGK